MQIVPISLKTANAYVEKYHRHHGKVVGHKFSIGLENEGELCGVIIVGRPVARHLDNGFTLEVTRCCTTGIKNGCSMLYSSAWRATRALGYTKLITYILKSETGSSLKASGWKVIGEVSGRSWNCKGRPRTDKSTMQKEDKFRFEME
jgi:hypothetical protein